MDKEKDSQEDTSLKCIEEYYRKYSTDSNLHKYFSGTSVSYLPPLRLDDELGGVRESPSLRDKPVDSDGIEKEADIIENISILSGKSELSEKKLEWDSGADIGYHNYNQPNKPMSSTGFRSLSLPTLKDLKDTKITFPVPSLPVTKAKTPSTHSSTSNSSSVKKSDILVVNYSSSPVPTSSRSSSSSATSDVVEKDKNGSSSSEEANSKTTAEQDSLKSKVAHLSETLNILKLAIGLPDAYSTPKFPEKAPAKLNLAANKGSSTNLPSSSRPSPVKVVNLTLSTPVTVQCVNSESPPTLHKDKSKKESHRNFSQQLAPTSKHVVYEQTTDSDLNASNCESFEYFDGNADLLPQPNLAIRNDSSVLQEDIDKAVTVIQQFFQSRQLNYSKKRHYIKKIIHKIESKFKTRFLEDSSSNQTTSPEMFVPRKEKHKKNILSDPHFDKKCFSDSVKTQSSPGHLKLLALTPSNVKPFKPELCAPQVYISESCTNPTSSHKLFNVEEGTSSLSTPGPLKRLALSPPESDRINIDKNVLKTKVSSSHEVLTSEKGTSSLTETPACLSITKKDEYKSKVVLSKIPTQVYVFDHFNNSTSCNTGKGSSSLSEKRPASSNNTKNVPSDCLVNFVKNEKAYQISWINNEIQHLTKLKKFLENPTENLHSSENSSNPQSFKINSKPQSSKNSSYPKSGENSGQSFKNHTDQNSSNTQTGEKSSNAQSFKSNSKPHSGKSSSKYEKITKTTYKITSSESEIEKDYVIRTRMNLETNQKPIFQLEGKRYCVEDTSSPARIVPKENTHCIINDIEVETIDSVTSIKINSICEQCKESICHCEASKGYLDPRPTSQPEITENYQSESSSAVYESLEYPNPHSEQSNDSKVTDVQDYYNSLKKIFDSCNCVKGEKCRCVFVKNILRYFGKRPCNAETQPEKGQLERNHNIGIQAKYATKNDRTETESQYLESNRENVGIQVENPTDEAETITNRYTENSQTQTINQGINFGNQVGNNTAHGATQSSTLALAFAGVQTELKVPQSAAISQTTNKVDHIGTQHNVRPDSNDVQVETESCACTSSDTQDNKTITKSKNTATQLTIGQNTNHTQTGLYQMRSSSQTEKTATYDGYDVGTLTKTKVNNTEVQANTKNKHARAGADFPIFKTQTSSTTDLNPPVSYSTQSTQTRIHGENVGGEVEYLAKFDIETQTSLDFIEKNSKIKSVTQTKETHFPDDTVKVKEKRQKSGDDLDDREIDSVDKIATTKVSRAARNPTDQESLAKAHTVDKSYQASAVNIETPSQISPDITSKQTQTRSKKYSDIRQDSKDPLTDRTNGISSSSTTTKHSSLNSTDLSESKKSGYPCSTQTICICCKSTSDLGSLFCNSCRKKYNIHKRTDSRKSYSNGYCSCSKTRYCKYCQCKLSKTSRSHGGIAYTLTLDSFSSEVEQQDNIVAKQDLEEIKMKVPKTVKQKSSKEKENYIKRNNGVGNEDDEEKKADKDAKASYSLQEYLASNRPSFVNMADYRRKVLTNSKTLREQKGDMGKFNFLEQNMEEKIPRKLFSNKEMKEITKRHYNKLAREKQMNEKKAKLKRADRLIADIFSKRLQQRVLTGERNFPIDTVLVNF